VNAPTPENVADLLADGGNDFYDDNGRKVYSSADGRIVRIDIARLDGDGNRLPDVHFRAVVAEVSEDAVQDGPLTLMTPPGGRVLLTLGEHVDLMDLSPEQAYAAAAQLIAAAAQGEAESRG